MKRVFLSEVSPFVRYFHTMQQIPLFCSTPVIPYDHRLFFLKKGNGRICLGDLETEVFAGNLIYVPAGRPYRWISYGAEAELIGVNFDFFKDHEQLVYPIPPVEEACFDANELLEQVEFLDATVFNDYLVVRCEGRLSALFQQMEQENAAQRTFYALHNAACLQMILTLAARDALTGDDGRSRRITEQVFELVQRRYAEPISNRDIAVALNYHPNYLNRLMLQATGHTLHGYLINYRFDRATSLLLLTDLSVSEVAARSGFADLSHFCRLCRKRTGYSPSQFRKKQVPSSAVLS